MADFNVNSQCKNWYTQRYHRAPRSINLEGLQLVSNGQPKWTNVEFEISKGPQRQVQVLNNGAGTVVNKLNATKVYKAEVSVSLDTDTIKGLSQPMRLTLPQKYHQYLKTVDFDPSKSLDHTVSQNKITSSDGCEMPPAGFFKAGRKTATAAIQTSQAEFQGSFSCSAHFKGHVDFDAGRANASDIFGSTVIEMVGHAHITWDMQVDIQWT